MSSLDGTVLDQIIAGVREDLAQRQRATSVAELTELAAARPAALDPIPAMRRAPLKRWPSAGGPGAVMPCCAPGTNHCKHSLNHSCLRLIHLG